MAAVTAKKTKAPSPVRGGPTSAFSLLRYMHKVSSSHFIFYIATSKMDIASV